MKNSVILIRFGEIFLKGKNRGWFESLIVRNLRSSLSGVDCILKIISGRYIVEGYKKVGEEEIISRINKVFGLHSFSRAVEIDTSEEGILAHLKTIKIENKTFKVAVNRADKTFPHTSQQFAPIAGDAVLEANASAKVDIHTPQILVNIDIRENKKTYIFFESTLLRGGLPVGASGKCLLLLSGGIDSPVAAYMMARRGMKVDFLHFHSYPHTSVQAKEKVFTLAKLLEGYCGKNKIFVANIKNLQEAVYKNADNSYMIIIMRRVMMSVARTLAKKHGYDCIATGESLGQVASQTVQSIALTDMMGEDVPILRPLIALDKTEIIKLAEDIGTFATSILPFEDCCTVFLPKHPVIKPVLKNVLREEARIEIEEITEKIIAEIESIC